MPASPSQPDPEEQPSPSSDRDQNQDQYGAAAAWTPSPAEREEEDIDKEIAAEAADESQERDSHEINEADDKASDAAEGAERKQLARMQSAMTETSLATSAAGTQMPEVAKKPWYQRLNPLRWGKVPPVPEERTVSPEYNAGFFSMLIFQWMAPLMTVSGRHPP
jgi:ATP-binding cassette, subfamily C (CFTR/MRP), member 1